MNELEGCRQHLRDARECLRVVVWAGQTLIRETAVGVIPPRRRSMELLAEALRDFRIAGLLER